MQCMSLEYDGSQINDMPSLLFPSLIKLGLFNDDTNVMLLLHVSNVLMLLNKIICVNWNMENHPRKQYNHNYYMALVLAD